MGWVYGGRLGWGDINSLLDSGEEWGRETSILGLHPVETREGQQHSLSE